MYNLNTDTIHFKVQVTTTGWIGFGFTAKNTTDMEDIDIVIGGVMADGSSFLEVPERSGLSIIKKKNKIVS